MNKILISSFEESFDDNLLLDNDIKMILNVASECIVSERVNREYLHIKIPDDDLETDITLFFPECFEFLDRAEKLRHNVIVHCLEGKSRSVCVVAAYLAVRNRKCFDDVLDRIKIERPCVDVFEKYLNDSRVWCWERVHSYK